MKTLIQTTFSSSILILVILIIHKIFLHKLPKKAFLILWDIVVINLFIPFSIKSQFSIYTFIDSIYKATELKKVDKNSEVLLNLITNSSNIPVQINNNSLLSSVSPIFIIWFAGFIICALGFIFIHLHCRKEYKLSIPIENEFILNWHQSHLIKRSFKIRKLDKISTPLTYGILKPVILLPKIIEYKNTYQIEYILTHELIHIKHFDTLRKWLFATALCIHWFNPFIWLMYKLANLDIEFSCDETVISTFGESNKSFYALTLIDMEEQRNKLSPICNSFNKNPTKERIEAIMKLKKLTTKSLLLSIILISGTLTVFATSKSNSNNKESKIYTVKEESDLEPVKNKEPYVKYDKFGTPSDDRKAEYEKYGIHFDEAENMFYNGVPVHYFWDGSLVDSGIGTHYEYLNEDGKVNLHTIRKPIFLGENNGFDPFGDLTEIVEFNENDNNRYTTIYYNILQGKTVNEYYSAAIHDTPSTSNNKKTSVPTHIDDTIGQDYLIETYSVYNKYGLIYNRDKGRLYYNGKLVRHFEDLLKTGPSSYSRFLSSTNKDGEVDVHAIFDDNGELIGIEPFSKEEFDARTIELQ